MLAEYETMIEQVKLPNIDEITLSLFFYHKLGPEHKLNANFNVIIAEGAISPECVTNAIC